MSERILYYCFAHRLTSGPAPRLHTHDNHEFFLCTAGAGEQHVPGHRHPTAPGDVFLFPAGQEHICWVGEEPACECLVLNVHPRALPESDASAESRAVLDELCRRARTGENRIPLSQAGQGQALVLLNEMVREVSAQEAGHHMALAVLYQQLLLLIVRDPLSRHLVSDAAQPSQGAERLAGVLHFLRYHFAEPVRVEEMARMACLSRSRFHDLFREATGQTLVEFVQRLRIEDAARRLRETDEPVLDVALACGFASLGHFYRIFARYHDQPPAALRRSELARCVQ